METANFALHFCLGGDDHFHVQNYICGTPMDKRSIILSSYIICELSCVIIV